MSNTHTLSLNQPHYKNQKYFGCVKETLKMRNKYFLREQTDGRGIYP